MADGFFTEAGRACRRVAVSIIARAWPGESLTDVEERIRRRSKAEQSAIVTAVLMLLFLAAVFAAQFGWVGMLV